MSWILFIMLSGSPTAILHLPDGSTGEDCIKQAILQQAVAPKATFACFPYVRTIV